jgi:hypothetical protein
MRRHAPRRGEYTHLYTPSYIMRDRAQRLKKTPTGLARSHAQRFGGVA